MKQPINEDKMINKIFNLNKKDYLYLIIIFIFSMCLIYYRTKFHMSGGILYPDKALYLINALQYSGLDYYNIAHPEDIFYSPIISFLTSLLFRMGMVDQLSISLVSSFFALIGFMGLYLLLRFRFNSILSLTGVILYGSATELLFNLSSGLLDVPAVSISILVLLFGIIAIDKDSKYFIITSLLLVVGFFTRYTVGFMFPLLILYYVMKRDLIENIDCILYDKSRFNVKTRNYLKSSEFKFIVLSIILSIILFVIICKYLILDYGGSLSFIQQSANTIKNSNYGVGSGIDVVYDKLFYLKNFSSIFFSEKRSLDRVFSLLIYCIIGIGALFKLDYFIRHFSEITEPVKEWKTKNFKKLLVSSMLFLMAMFISFKVFHSHMLTNIFFLMFIMLFYSLINGFNINRNEQALNLLFLSYFAINFIFISIYSTKTIRYALPLIPPLVYFIIYCIEGILDNFDNQNDDFKVNLSEDTFNEKQYPRYRVYVLIALIVILMMSSFFFIKDNKIYGPPNELVDVTDFIISIDPDYHQKTFGSNYRDSRIIRWYMQVNLTCNDDYDFSDSAFPSYIISDRALSLDNYDEMYNKGQYYAYHLMTDAP